MISATNITFRYIDRPLYRAGNFSVGRGMKVGIVGPNGAGKSTLLKLITGEEVPDEGQVRVEGTLASVPQEVRYDMDLETAPTVQAYIDPTGKLPDYELEKMLAGIGLPELRLDMKPFSMSGGQKTRLAIIRALVREPDILLLDEPTNFLDLEGKKWVMDFLMRFPNTLVLISHDIELIDASIDKVIAINPTTQTIDEHKGSYSNYLAVKGQKEDLLKRQILNEQKHIKRMKIGLRKMDRFTSDKGVRQRTQLKKRIKRLEEALPEAPKELRLMRFSMPEPTRVGELPLIVDGVSKSFDGVLVLEELSFAMRRGERLALIGPNGVGKSTLIKIIMGLLDAESGSVHKDAALNIGYYSQEKESFDEEKTVLESILEASPFGEPVVRPILAGFLFGGNKVFQQIKRLSGGEKTRLAIAHMLSQSHNMLILDEPTTYLDTMSQRVILEALKRYTGTLLVVSHTPQFIQELQPDRALLMPQGVCVKWGDELLREVAEV
jgi:ATP-binding cassette, subfamily F, member 3